MKKYFILISALLLTIACEEKQDKKEELLKSTYQVEKNKVDTIILKRGVFKQQLNSNGKLKSINKSDLRFGESGKIIEINVKNGLHVKKGDIIARLDSEALELSIKGSKVAMSKAELQMKDYLIGQGCDINNMGSIDSNMLSVAEIRSGYADANASLQIAEQRLKSRVIVAPFDGVIANLDLKVNEYFSDKFCTLIDDSKFEVEFPVLETEVYIVKKGGEVSINPFSDTQTNLKGTITEVNPVVDKNGLIKIRAMVRNNGKLMEGMNVNTYVEKDVYNKLVVPKSAVVIRDNLEVLFTYEKDGTAKWTYVHTAMANKDYYVVEPNEDRSAELKEGNAVIYVGNLNLADGSQVEIINKSAK